MRMYTKANEVTREGSEITTLTYDPLYRLTSASSNDGDLFQYIYDTVGNRLTETTIGNVTLNYTYDNANRLSNAEGVSYTWDDNGNLLSDGVTAYMLKTVKTITQDGAWRSLREKKHRFKYCTSTDRHGPYCPQLSLRLTL